MELYNLLPPDAAKFVIVLFLSFLIGLEREEHRAEPNRYSFGGVRTYPLIGLIGYAMAILSRGQLIPVTLGFLAVAGFLMLSYWRKLTASAASGVTSEMSGLVTYLVGALVYYDQIWIATALCVAGLLLLETKTLLEGLARRIPPEEILTFATFLLLSAVILPVLPNQDFGPFHLNPFKAWLIVVAVSAISYGSYVIDRMSRGRGGILLTAVLGGAYSSTVTTVVLAKRSARENRPHLFAGGTLVASGLMYLRLAILVGMFNRDLMSRLGPVFLGLSALAAASGWLWSRLPDPSAETVAREFQTKNPLEIRTALLLAALFLTMVVATHFALTYLGKAGLYALAAVMGTADVDPFIMGMTQTGGVATPLDTAAAAILIAAASNNLAKGAYAYTWSDRRTGVQSLALLVSLALAGLAPLLWVWK